ncbi:MAG: UDP-N-acetylmuramate--alanine ligase [Planctomycetota bacterium]|nr:MAG: UDP-N-acetylmuramate--alanine ligase [Planctomycetota bacterium]
MIPYSSIAFCGIAGSGMSAIAQVLIKQGIKISGSDRNFDHGKCLNIKSKLESQGIKIYPQDGSCVTSNVDALVISTAVEATIPDIEAAKSQNITIIRRAELLALIFNQNNGIAVAGTSGKSTVTGILGFLLEQNNCQPAIINGGIMENYKTDTAIGNAFVAGENYTVIEADESDGTLELYNPLGGLLLNISLDHKPLEELRPLFLNYANRCKDHLVINYDCPETMALAKKINQYKTFSIKSDKADFYAENIIQNPHGSTFVLNEVTFELPQPGLYNIANALAAISMAIELGVPLEKLAKSLAKFKGIGRRLQIIGSKNGRIVIDDFAHNAEKIEASMMTLSHHAGADNRILYIYQPHGFAPTRMLKNQLIETFSKYLRKNDILLLPEIFYAGGTVTRDISSNDLVVGIVNNGKDSKFFNNREEIKSWILENNQEGDTIVIMGARDDTLTDYAKDILEKI